MQKRVAGLNLLHVIVILMTLLLLLNSVLLAKSVGYITLPGEMSRTDVARGGAKMTIEMSEQLARDADVYDKSAVREVIAQFKYEIERSSTPESIVMLTADYSRKVQDVISREQDSKRRDTVLSIMNRDSALTKFSGESSISIWKGEDGLRIIDPTGLMAEETKQEIMNNPLMHGPSWSLVEIAIKEGQLSLMTSRSMVDKIRILENDKANLERRLKQVNIQAGFAELGGTGVVVEMYDSEFGYGSIDIVHDRDVRDVINELFAAGAEGISVGGQRLIATTSIRCAGPIILVNQKPIAVDPIVIVAVGDPKVLASSLEFIKAELMEFGIKINVTQDDYVAVPAYSEKVILN